MKTISISFRITFGVTLIGIALLSFATMPANSYLSHKAVTTAELVSEVHSIPAVADHYERHFQMTRSQIENYFSTLHVARLTETQSYVMYGVPENGAIHSHLQTLKRGDQVWEDQGGTPILYCSCGNPISRTGFFRSAPVSGSVISVIPITPSQKIATHEIISPTNEIALLPSVPATPKNFQPTVSSVPSPIQMQVARNSQNYLLPLAILAGTAIYLTTNHHHHSPPQAVPAPNAALELGMVCFGLVSIRKRRFLSRLH